MSEKKNQKITRLKVVVWLLLQSLLCFSQQADSIWTSPDTLTAVIKAFETNRPAQQVPAAVSIIDKDELQRFTNTSMVSALNTRPGIRMEERSPGSYRLNLRGSSLRSPFGIRNVKVYLNDIPLTDPGGNTYLNQFDYHAFSSVEVIKGPASSLYGAGSGGAMLLHTLKGSANKIELDLLGGSYGLAGAHASGTWGGKQGLNKLDFAHLQSAGWRDHTNMRRDIALYENIIRASDKLSLQTMFMYGNLFYETPGALTFAQYQQNPRAARYAGGPFPSAATAKAAIYQQTFLAGFTTKYDITETWKNTTAVYGANSWFRNPTFRLYEKRTEPHTGGRTFFTNDFITGAGSIHLVYGAEVQKGIFSSQTFNNRNGSPDTMQTNDEVNNWRYSIFTQAEWLLAHGWNITTGLSYNKSYAGIDRLLTYPVVTQKRTFNSELAPRLALMKNFRQVSVYATLSKGFSPPTVSELLPGTGIINTTLKAEEGINYEAGAKGSFFNHRLNFEIAAYHFYINDAISQRRDASGGDYYVNAGKTRQNGIEVYGQYALIKRNALLKAWTIAAAYTGNFYRYVNYKVVEENYNGNRLPGIPKDNVVLTTDVIFNLGFYTNITYQHTGKIALNDANSAYADAYQLLSVRAGWQLSFQEKHLFDIFIAGDNLLDETYSLGNDINAAANRYYNAAAGRNFSFGVSYKLR